MKTVIVQVTKDYLCLTCCEPIIQTKDQKKETTVDLSYRFTSPYIKPLDTKYMEGKSSVWEIPKAFATMVNDGLREMKRPEVKEVVILVEEFDLVSSEFQHVKCKRKILENLAIEQLREVLQDDVKQFSVITTTYGNPAKEVTTELTSKTFGIPRALSSELDKRFSEMGLTLLKIIPADIPALKISREIVYSFNKTICYISVDYAALRVILVKDSLPLYCHTFRSPMTEAIDIIAQDRQLSTQDAAEYIKQNGLTAEYVGNTPSASQRIMNLREDIMADIVHNVNLVALSLDINIDQVVLSDAAGFFPHVTNIVKKMGISLDVDLISDQFNTKMAVPELDIDARDGGFKTGSFILFNNMMNCGDKYKNNLMVGLQPLKEKSLDIGKQVSIAVSVIVGAAVITSGGFYAFLNIQKGLDEAKFKEPNYVKAADLLQRQADIQQKLKDQVTDAAKLPNCPLFMCDTLEQTKKQIADKIKSLDGYSLSYTDSGKTSEPEIDVPISGAIKDFDALLKLKDDLTKDGFFIVGNNFSISEKGVKDSYMFSLNAKNIVDTEEETQRLNVVNGRANSTEASTENATESSTESSTK